MLNAIKMDGLHTVTLQTIIQQFCLFPRPIAGWSVGCRETLTGRSQSGLDLFPMVAGMKDTAPGCSDLLPFHPP